MSYQQEVEPQNYYSDNQTPIIHNNKPEKNDILFQAIVSYRVCKGENIRDVAQHLNIKKNIIKNWVNEGRYKNIEVYEEKAISEDSMEEEIKNSKNFTSFLLSDEDKETTGKISEKSDSIKENPKNIQSKQSTNESDENTQQNLSIFNNFEESIEEEEGQQNGNDFISQQSDQNFKNFQNQSPNFIPILTQIEEPAENDEIQNLVGNQLQQLSDLILLRMQKLPNPEKQKKHQTQNQTIISQENTEQNTKTGKNVDQKQQQQQNMFTQNSEAYQRKTSSLTYDSISQCSIEIIIDQKTQEIEEKQKNQQIKLKNNQELQYQMQMEKVQQIQRNIQQDNTNNMHSMSMRKRQPQKTRFESPLLQSAQQSLLKKKVQIIAEKKMAVIQKTETSTKQVLTPPVTKVITRAKNNNKHTPLQKNKSLTSSCSSKLDTPVTTRLQRQLETNYNDNSDSLLDLDQYNEETHDISINRTHIKQSSSAKTVQ